MADGALARFPGVQAVIGAVTLVWAAGPAVAAPAPVPGFPVGCLVRVQQPGGLEVMKAAGMEFVEVGLRDVVALTDADFEALLARSRALSLPVRAAINFLPPDLKVVGPQVDVAAQRTYLARAFARGQRLGLQTVVFGSGKARSFPDGFSPDQAFRQLVEFGRLVAAQAHKHAIVIAIEPLGPDETNTINDVAAAMRLVRAVGHRNFQIAVDYYHLTLAREPPAVVLATRKHLRHVRIANPDGRAFPLDASESDYATFFRHLKQIGYRGGIGIEARKGDPATDGARSVAFLRTMAAQHLAR
jgi:sugar phosphate isomerase/epimerase